MTSEIDLETKDQYDFIDDQYLKEITYFETFLNRIGFKRIDGSIYGLLVLSSRPLTSEEIETTLGLSQSAVSQSLKSLAHYNAIETADSPENKRIKIHWAKDDSLNIVSTVFRKRESQYVEEFKMMAQRLLKKAIEDNSPKRVKRLKSIIITCETAEVVMNFVMGLTKLQVQEHYDNILTKLPKNLDFLMKSAESFSDIGEMRDSLGTKFKNIKKNFIG